MKKLTFKQLPLIVKIGLGIIFYNAWWSIEEFVIDRHWLWKLFALLQGGWSLCLGPNRGGNYHSCSLLGLAERKSPSKWPISELKGKFAP